MNGPYHALYVAGSLLAALVSVGGFALEQPLLYATLPGLIGGFMALGATIRFLRYKQDLAGFVATVCGFVFYQAFQTNPVTLRDFVVTVAALQDPDRQLGLFLGNFTTGLLLVAHHVAGFVLRTPFAALVPAATAASRPRVDATILKGFLGVFAMVALPNVLFGLVVVGAIKNIVYQRASWSLNELSGYTTWGGAVGASLLNTVFWSTSMFLLWLYLLQSKYRAFAYVVAPLVLIWTASVALQGSRTYFVVLSIALVVYFLGDPRLRGKVFVYGALGGPVVLLTLQVSTLFRTEGLHSFNFRELAEHAFEIRGNEGTTSQIDGFEFFRTELLERDRVPNPILGAVRGLLERPLEGILMPVPRSVFPWKPVDETAREFTLFYQNIRLNVPSNETFLGASPGLFGRELIRYGYFGPLTLLFWLGSVLALADRLYTVEARSDFHRIFAAMLVAFVVAQMRDWVPMWFLPFLPAFLVFAYVARKARRLGPIPVRRRVRAAPVTVSIA